MNAVGMRVGAAGDTWNFGGGSGPKHCDLRRAKDCLSPRLAPEFRQAEFTPRPPVVTRQARTG